MQFSLYHSYNLTVGFTDSKCFQTHKMRLHVLKGDYNETRKIKEFINLFPLFMLSRGKYLRYKESPLVRNLSLYLRYTLDNFIL